MAQRLVRRLCPHCRQPHQPISTVRAKYDELAKLFPDLFATAPREAPTTRGFASILVQGLAGLTADDVLAVPDDFPQTLGLTQAVSPLRIRGMSALRRKQSTMSMRVPCAASASAAALTSG